MMDWKEVSKEQLANFAQKTDANSILATDELQRRARVDQYEVNRKLTV